MRLAALPALMLLGSAAFAADRRVDAAFTRAVVEHCLAATSPLDRPCTVDDFDGDHAQDLAYSNPSTRGHGFNTITVFLAQSGREQQVDISRWPQASRVVARDVDGDDDHDLVLTNPTRRTLAVFLNDGSGAFAFDASEAHLDEPEEDDVQFGIPSVASNTPAAVDSLRSIPLVAGVHSVWRFQIPSSSVVVSDSPRSDSAERGFGPNIRAP